MKKLLNVCISLFFIVFTLCLTSCGKSSGDTLYILSFKPEYNEFFDVVNKIFLEENPSIKKIDYKAVDTANFNTVFDSRISSGYLDVFTSQVIYMMQGSANYMEELDMEYYRTILKDKYLEAGSYYDETVDSNEHLLTLPLEDVATGVFYNKDIFESYNVQVPTTWEEFIQVCEIFNELSKYPSGNYEIECPIILGGKEEWPAKNIVNALIGDTVLYRDKDWCQSFANYDNDETLRVNTNEWISSIEKLTDISKYISQYCYGLSYSSTPSYFANGRKIGNTTSYYPMMIDGSWSYASISTEMNIGFFPLPCQSSKEEKPNIPCKCGTSLSVFKNSNKKELAKKYLEICFREDVYKQFLSLTKMPSVVKNLEQDNELISSIFDTEKYNFVDVYDSAMPRYMPIISPSDVISIMKGTFTAKAVLDQLQSQIDLSKEDWFKYTKLRHRK